MISKGLAQDLCLTVTALALPLVRVIRILLLLQGIKAGIPIDRGVGDGILLVVGTEVRIDVRLEDKEVPIDVLGVVTGRPVPL